MSIDERYPDLTNRLYHFVESNKHLFLSDDLSHVEIAEYSDATGNHVATIHIGRRGLRFEVYVYESESGYGLMSMMYGG